MLVVVTKWRQAAKFALWRPNCALTPQFVLPVILLSSISAVGVICFTKSIRRKHEHSWCCFFSRQALVFVHFLSVCLSCMQGDAFLLETKEINFRSWEGSRKVFDGAEDGHIPLVEKNLAALKDMQHIHERPWLANILSILLCLILFQGRSSFVEILSALGRLDSWEPVQYSGAKNRKCCCLLPEPSRMRTK